ncbi:MAG: mitochondrial fission ELM1 family protein [Rhodanobacteraceae bacterium]|nr:mitochondrial fission ELM1 family protein [Rhodanobacteraceae bacterium]
MTSHRFATVLALSDHAAGNRRQATALAQALRADAHHAEVRFPHVSRWLAPHLPDWAMNSLPPIARDTAGPMLAIGCGRQAALALRALKRARGREVFALQILDPRCKLDDFDLLVVPEHDGLAGPKVLHTLGALHPVDERWLSQARENFPNFAGLPKPWTSALIGGPNHAQSIDAHWLERLFDQLARQRDSIGTLAVSASRRTPPKLRELLRRHALKLDAMVWLDDRDGPNPYPALLAYADRIVVSPDSVNMISEAVAVGVPVHTLLTQPLKGKLQRFHAALRERGLLHDLAARGWPRPPLRELPAIVDEVRARLTYTLG